MMGVRRSRQMYWAFEPARYVPMSEASVAEYTAADCTSISTTSQCESALAARYVFVRRLSQTSRAAMSAARHVWWGWSVIE